MKQCWICEDCYRRECALDHVGKIVTQCYNYRQNFFRGKPMRIITPKEVDGENVTKGTALIIKGRKLWI